MNSEEKMAEFNGRNSDRRIQSWSKRKKKKAVRKKGLTSATHFFIPNRIKSKIYKTSRFFEASVC